MKVAAMVIVDPVRNVAVDDKILKNFYGVTSAEVKLVNAMANGVKPAQFASETDKSVATVQSQRQAVFQKVGVTSQLELMRVLRDLIVSFEKSATTQECSTGVH